MQKKRRFIDLCLALFLLAGLGLGAAMVLAPDRAGDAWQSLQAAVESWTAGQAEHVALPPPPPPPSPSPSKMVKAERAPKRADATVTAAKVPKKHSLLVSSAEVAAEKAVATESPAETVAQAGKEDGAAPPAAAGTFEFPSDEAGRLLADRLTPPQHVPLAPMPPVREPQPRLSNPVDALISRAATLPPAVNGPAPLVVQAERRSPQRNQAALDRPPLAAEVDPARPTRPTWPVSSLAYAPSASAEAVPALRHVGVPVSDKITPQDDPTAESARAALLAGTSIPKPTAPPPLRLTIPDPFENARVVQLANPPAERDPPEPSFQRPQPPPLPMPEQPKAKQ
jgi:hypothetical protein